MPKIKKVTIEYEEEPLFDFGALVIVCLIVGGCVIGGCVALFAGAAS